MGQMIVWDIETGPLPDDELEKFIPPFDPETAVPHPGEFDPSSVKTGNTKDASKIAEKIEQCRAAHQQAVEQYDLQVMAAEVAHRNSVIEKAALSPITGRVLAIGIHYTQQNAKRIWGHGIDGETEAQVIDEFWRLFDVISSRPSGQLIGFNIFGFDLPFLIRRSWILGVDVPSDVQSGRYFNSCFIDLMHVWGCGQYGSGSMIKLDALCQAFGLPGKNGSGKEFAGLWESDRQAAIEYLKNDLAITAAVAKRMGVC